MSSLGPVQIFTVAFEGSRPTPELIGAVLDRTSGESVRLVDLVIVIKDIDSDVTVVEIEDIAGELGIDIIELPAGGLTGEDDVEELAADLSPGSSAVIAVIEHQWAADLAAGVLAAGGEVVDNVWIPAETVNELLELVEAN